MFPEDSFKEIFNDDGHSILDSSKIYKIRYEINLLPTIGTHIDLKLDENGK